MPPLETPRRLRDVARMHAQTSADAPPASPAPAPAPADGHMMTCPECGAALSLKAVSTGSAPPAMPMNEHGKGAMPTE